MYINTTDSTYPHSEADIRRAFPNTSFANPFMPPDEYKVVFPAPAPAVNPITHTYRETAPVLTVKGHYEQAYEVIALDAERVAANQAAKAAQDFQSAKTQRAALVEAIKVTTQAGNEFDGDEISQTRMARAIIALSTGLAPSVSWVLANNTIVDVTAAELTEALVLSGQAQAAIWVAPYEAPAA
jgi:hypothetical protein